MDSVSLSRLQFGMTAMYHFIFIPLTLGLSILLVIMEIGGARRKILVARRGIPKTQ